MAGIVPLGELDGRPFEGTIVGAPVKKVPERPPEEVLKLSVVGTVPLGELDERILEGPTLGTTVP